MIKVEEDARDKNGDSANVVTGSPQSQVWKFRIQLNLGSGGRFGGNSLGDSADHT